MKNLLIVAACISSMAATAQNRQIEFKEASWKEQLAQAKKDNKLIFFDAYTSWCGPCKMMAKDVFTKDSVADLFNNTFLNVKYDMEKGEGIALKTKYGVQAYPTYLFIDGSGEIVHKIVGGMSPAEFMAEANKALDPSSTAFGLAKKFNAGDHSEATTMAYLKALEIAYEADKIATVAKTYFDGLPQSALMEKSNWQLINKYLHNPAAKSFAYLYANKAGLEKQHSPVEVSQYFQQTFGATVNSVGRAYRSKATLNEAKEKTAAMRKLLLGDTSPATVALLAQLDFAEYGGLDQWDKFCALGDRIVGGGEMRQKSMIIMSAANDLVNNAPAKHYTNALNWATEIERNNADMFVKIQIADLRKRILKRQGKEEEANAMGAKAAELRKEAMKARQMTPPMFKD